MLESNNPLLIWLRLAIMPLLIQGQQQMSQVKIIRTDPVVILLEIVIHYCFGEQLQGAI